MCSRLFRREGAARCVDGVSAMDSLLEGLLGSVRLIGIGAGGGPAGPPTCGIGAAIGRDHAGRVVITEVLVGGAAWAGGLAVGDVIVAVQFEDVEGEGVDDVATRILGPDGSLVTLSLRCAHTDPVVGGAASSHEGSGMGSGAANDKPHCSVRHVPLLRGPLRGAVKCWQRAEAEVRLRTSCEGRTEADHEGARTVPVNMRGSQPPPLRTDDESAPRQCVVGRNVSFCPHGCEGACAAGEDSAAPPTPMRALIAELRSLATPHLTSPWVGLGGGQGDCSWAGVGSTWPHHAHLQLTCERMAEAG